MSASLVGSEMCIRDRHVTKHSCLRAGGKTKHPQGLPLTRAPSTLMPVSYTHLTLPTICSV
eukprot:3403322-Alexandrium_andersonii.AAC.1